jgi:CBS domain-containing protein
MTRASDLLTLGPDDTVDAAVRHMAERHLNQLPVVTDGRLVGMIARVNILRFMDLKDLSESDRR